MEKNKREVTQATATSQFSISRNHQISGIRQVAANLVYQPPFVVTRESPHVFGSISPCVPLSSLTQFWVDSLLKEGLCHFCACQGLLEASSSPQLSTDTSPRHLCPCPHQLVLWEWQKSVKYLHSNPAPYIIVGCVYWNGTFRFCHLILLRYNVDITEHPSWAQAELHLLACGMGYIGVFCVWQGEGGNWFSCTSQRRRWWQWLLLAHMRHGTHLALCISFPALSSH